MSGLLVCATPAFAQNQLASQEAAKRVENAQSAYALIESGDAAYGVADYLTALTKYDEALALLPEGAKAVSAVRQLAVQRLVQATLAYGRNLKRRGNYDEAERLLENVDRYAPDDPKVAKFRAQVEDPIRTNPALTPEHTANIDRVRRLLYEAEGYYDLGKFDRAEMTYEDILRIDPYNKAARRGMERVAAAKSDYLVAARDQARAKLLNDIDAEWEMKDHQDVLIPLLGTGTAGELDGVAGVFEKLNTIMLPEVNLNDATLDEAIDFLRAMSVQLDETTSNESAKGVGFIIQLGDEDHPAVKEVRAQRITLQLRNIPMVEALKQIANSVKADYRVDEYAVVITAAGFSDPTLIRREFRVPPDFLTAGVTAQADVDSDPFGGAVAAEGGLIAKKLTAVEKLKSFDLPFPEGATASYNARTNILTVRNTAENLAMVDAIVQSVSLTEPVIVAIRTTIIDISEKNLEELGFDTMLGEFSVGNAYSLSGGTTGTGVAIDDMIGGNPVTSGLRSGDLTSTSDGLDALLAREGPISATGTINSGVGGNTSSINIPNSGGGGSLRAPGVISLRGIINNTGHEILMRGLSQKKGVNLMVRPEVMTRPGQNAVVQSIMQFRYPTEYEPPQLPSSVGSSDGIVTPATPTSFEVKDLGVSLEVLPEVGPDRQIIEVQVNPVITDLEGFVNYGSPITGARTTSTIDFVGQTTSSSSTFGELTKNEILMPLFRTIRGNTAIRIADGQTIVMGGLLQEVRKNVNDKVPVLGDLPLVGRIFRNDAVSIEKRSVLIFVNVELLDPAGNPYRKR
ncbi:Amuc_1098 family type IV pilus outer membrane protein [Verrucomicrobiaceae bacterium 227]